MTPLLVAAGLVAVLALILVSLSPRIVQQYEQGVLFRLGRVIGTRAAGLTLIIPVVDRLDRVSLRIVTMPIQSQGTGSTPTPCSLRAHMTIRQAATCLV